MKPGWFDLPRAERRAVVAAAMLVPVAHLLVRVCGYRRVMSVAERTAARWPARQGALADPAVIDQLRLATARVQRYSPLPGNCLSRSLVLWWQLRRRGLAPALRLGASLAGGVFAAHAWVEHEGRVLNDTADVAGRYAPLT
jgi:hypothetical protein